MEVQRKETNSITNIDEKMSCSNCLWHIYELCENENIK